MSARIEDSFALNEANTPPMLIEADAPQALHTSSEVFARKTQPTNLSAPLTAEEKRQAIDRAARAMEQAFICWDRTGDFGAAAGYHRMRQEWETLLTTWRTL